MKYVVVTTMKNFALCFLFISLLSLSVATYSQQIVVDAPTRHKVLVLLDSDTLTLWKQAFINGLQVYLNEFQDETEPVMLTYEFLEQSYFGNGESSDWFVEGLKNKQRISPAEIIVSVLPASSNFVYERATELYPDAEMLYAVPDTRTENSIRNNFENVQLVPSVSEKAFENTLRLIPELLPDLENLYVLAYTDFSDGQYLDESQPYLDSLPDRIKVNYLVGQPTEDVKNLILNAPPKIGRAHV